MQICHRFQIQINTNSYYTNVTTNHKCMSFTLRSVINTHTSHEIESHEYNTVHSKYYFAQASVFMSAPRDRISVNVFHSFITWLYMFATQETATKDFQKCIFCSMTETQPNRRIKSLTWNCITLRSTYGHHWCDLALARRRTTYNTQHKHKLDKTRKRKKLHPINGILKTQFNPANNALNNMRFVLAIL